eukprot:m.68671 g.68671  ORF g.68671 m.68671 type:complete len:315 (-) comp8252_c0_seq1:195-1139(-)
MEGASWQVDEEDNDEDIFHVDDDVNDDVVDGNMSGDHSSSNKKNGSSRSGKKALLVENAYDGFMSGDGIGIDEDDITYNDKDELLLVKERDDGSDDEQDDSSSGLDNNNAAPLSFWTFAYYQSFFNVDTNEVLKRLKLSALPSSRFFKTVKGKGDLYGPFWICTTLIFALAMTANVAHYFATPSHERASWRYDFGKVSLAASTIYGYITMVPLILFGILYFYKSITASLFDILCLYGYSMSIFIAAAVLCGVLAASNAAQWGIVITAMLSSGAVLLLNLNSMVANKAISFTILVTASVFHVALAMGYKLYFFQF